MALAATSRVKNNNELTITLVKATIDNDVVLRKHLIIPLDLLLSLAAIDLELESIMGDIVAAGALDLTEANFNRILNVLENGITLDDWQTFRDKVNDDFDAAAKLVLLASISAINHKEHEKINAALVLQRVNELKSNNYSISIIMDAENVLLNSFSLWALAATIINESFASVLIEKTKNVDQLRSLNNFLLQYLFKNDADSYLSIAFNSENTDAKTYEIFVSLYLGMMDYLSANSGKEYVVNSSDYSSLYKISQELAHNNRLLNNYFSILDEGIHLNFRNTVEMFLEKFEQYPREEVITWGTVNWTAVQDFILSLVLSVFGEAEVARAANLFNQNFLNDVWSRLGEDPIEASEYLSVLLYLLRNSEDTDDDSYQMIAIMES